MVSVLGGLNNFAGGLAQGIQAGDKMRLADLADKRAQEAHDDEMRKSRQEQADAQQLRQRYGPGTNQVYTGTSFPDVGHDTYDQAQAAASGSTVPTDTIGFLKQAEGFNPNAYSDYRQTSIGYGARAMPGETAISPQDAEARLASEAGKVGDFINQNVKVPLTQGQRTALTSFGYNLGTGQGGLSDLLPAVNSGNWQGVARQMQSYNRAGGQVNDGLVSRRKMEAGLLFQPDAPAAQPQAPVGALPSTPNAPVQTASVNSGMATDAAPAASPRQAALPSSMPSIQRQGQAASVQTAPAQAAASQGQGRVVVRDPMTGRYHAVPADQVRDKTQAEQLKDVGGLLLAQGKPQAAADMFKRAADLQVEQAAIDKDAAAQELSRSAVDPTAFAKTTNKLFGKLGTQLNVSTDVVDAGDGKKATVLKFEPTGTNATAFYLDRNGQMSTTPDPSAYTANVMMVQGMFAGDTAAAVAHINEIEGRIQQIRHDKQNEALEAQNAPLQQAKVQSEIDASKANSDYQKGLLAAHRADEEAKKRQLFNESVDKLTLGGILDPSKPAAYAQQVGALAKRHGIAPEVDFTEVQKGNAALPSWSAASPSALAAASPANTKVANPFLASAISSVPAPRPAPIPAVSQATSTNPFLQSVDGSYQPMNALRAPSGQAQTALPSGQAQSALPAPQPSTFGRIVNYLAEAPERHAALRKAEGEANWSGPAGKAYSDLVDALSSGKPPKHDDLVKVTQLLAGWPSFSERMDPRIVDYIHQYGSRW